MEDFYKLFINAFEYFLEKRYLDSLSKLTEAEKMVGENYSREFTTSLENLKGFNYLALNYTDYARECFEKSLALDKNSSQACAGLGELFFLEQKDKEAKGMYEWAVKNNPDNLFAVNGLAKVNEILGLPREHNTLDEEVIVKVNENIRQLIFSVNDLYGNGNYADAVKNIIKAERAVELEIEDRQELLTEMLNMKGTALLKLDELDPAMQAFEKALQLKPDSSHACWGLAEIFFRNEQFTEAKTMYEWAVKNDAQNASAAEGLIKANIALNLPEKNNMLLENESHTLQDKVDEILVEAYDLFQNKNYTESLSLLNQIEDFVIENETENLADIISSIKNFKGFNSLALNELEEAKANFEKALNLNSSSSQACAGLGELLFIEGRDKESKMMFEWAVQNDPRNAFAKGGLEKVNRILNMPPDHNSLSGEQSLTFNSGRTLSVNGV